MCNFREKCFLKDWRGGSNGEHGGASQDTQMKSSEK